MYQRTKEPEWKYLIRYNTSRGSRVSGHKVTSGSLSDAISIAKDMSYNFPIVLIYEKECVDGEWRARHIRSVWGGSDGSTVHLENALKLHCGFYEEADKLLEE